MLDKLQDLADTYNSLKDEMMKPEVASDTQASIKIGKEMSQLQEAYDLFLKYRLAHSARVEALEILETEEDGEMKDLAKAQLYEADDNLSVLDEQVKVALLPKDPNDDKNIYLEVRPAAWWDEAWLFANELLRVYLMYAQQQWRNVEVMENDISDNGGLKLAVVKISGTSVYSYLKWESWVHRVQRIPATESKWRVHTSTITVAIMPEVDDVEVDIHEDDITMDTFAASSAWWQNANKNQTWVRLHHNPTGIMVTIADSKSQRANREKAFQILKAKLYQAELQKQQDANRELRGNQIGNWDRSEKIRTYNFPQDRMTDHRIKESWSNLPSIMSWNIHEILQELIVENQTRMLSQLGE